MLLKYNPILKLKWHKTKEHYKLCDKSDLTDEKFQIIKLSLKKHIIFHSFDEKQTRLFAEEMFHCTIGPDKNLITEGENGYSFFVLG